MKQLKPLTIAAIMAVLVLGIVLLRSQWFQRTLDKLLGRSGESDLVDKDMLETTSGNTGIGTRLNYCSVAGPPNCHKILKEGSVGLEVCMLQRWLNQNPGRRGTIAVDGIFGPQTRSALFEQTQFSEVQLSVLNAC